MYVTPRQKKRYIFNVLFVAIAIPLTVLAGYTVTQIISDASTEAVPENVSTSNLTTNSLTLTWTTPTDASGEVIVTKNGQASQPIKDFRGSGDRKTHYVEIVDLAPETEYSFVIRSNGNEYGSEGGAPFEFTTSPLTEDTPVPNPVYGGIPDLSGDDAIVYIYTSSEPNSLPLSSVPSTTGNWIFDLSTLRSIDGTQLVPVSSETQLTILALGPDETGAKHIGAYSDTFDGGGKLDSSVDLTLQEGFDISQELPSQSLITTISQTTTPTPPVPEPEPEPEPPVEPEPEPEPEPDIGKPDFDPSQREFRIVQDVPWTDLYPNSVVPSGNTDTSDKPNIQTGEDSIKLVNQSDNGFGVVWMSENPSSGYVKYGTSPDALTEEANDVRDGLVERGTYNSHLVELNDLDPETDYYYEIVSGSETYTGSGSTYSNTTYSTLTSPPPFETISGSVAGADSIDDVVVLVVIEDEDGEGSEGDSNYVAVVLDARGGWIASIGDIRNEDGSEYYSYTDDDKLTTSMYIYAETSPVVIKCSEITGANIELEATLFPPVLYTHMMISFLHL